MHTELGEGAAATFVRELNPSNRAIYTQIRGTMNTERLRIDIPDTVRFSDLNLAFDRLMYKSLSKYR
jgi:hypothetical protein